MTRLQQLKDEFIRQSAALDEKHRQQARLDPLSESSTKKHHEVGDLVSQHTRQISEWLNSPEGHAERIAEKIAEVRDLEYRYRTVIEDPTRAWFISPVTPKTIGFMRERQLLYAAFIKLYDEQGAEAFMVAYANKYGNGEGLAEQLARSYGATEETKKIEGSKSRRGEQQDGGHYLTLQTVDDPVVLEEDDPLVARQRQPPAKPLYEQTYAEYLERHAAFREQQIQFYTKCMPSSRRMAADSKACLRDWQQLQPMTEREKERRGNEMRMEMQAGKVLSDRKRREGMNLIIDRLAWILIKVRRRHYTLEALCKEFKMPRVWGKALEIYAVGTGRISQEEWNQAFNRPGKPKAGKPRGPYKKREGGQNRA